MVCGAGAAKGRGAGASLEMRAAARARGADPASEELQPERLRAFAGLAVVEVADRPRTAPCAGHRPRYWSRRRRARAYELDLRPVEPGQLDPGLGGLDLPQGVGERRDPSAGVDRVGQVEPVELPEVVPQNRVDLGLARGAASRRSPGLPCAS